MRPPREPTIAPIVKIISNDCGREVARELNRKRRGKSFCQVDRRRQRCQLRPDMTFGNQKWRGAAPALIIRLEINMSLGKEGNIVEFNHVTEIRRRREPRV